MPSKRRKIMMADARYQKLLGKAEREWQLVKPVLNAIFEQVQEFLFPSSGTVARALGGSPPDDVTCSWGGSSPPPRQGVTCSWGGQTPSPRGCSGFKYTPPTKQSPASLVALWAWPGTCIVHL